MNEKGALKKKNARTLVTHFGAGGGESVAGDSFDQCVVVCVRSVQKLLNFPEPIIV